MDAVRETGAELMPVDSEHNGAHQCLRAGNRDQVSKLILTASGGPFRNTPKEALASVTPTEALNHPTWKMGKRITIDSATLMNKGFEVIEACWLFDFAPAQVDVVVHPQSTVHAMVEYNDGSVIAQISATDMRMPIQYALTWPERWQAPVPKIDWSEARHWEFCASGFRPVSAAEAGLPVPGGGRLRDLYVECGRRNRRGGVSRRAKSVSRHRGRGGRDAVADAEPASPAVSATFWRSTRNRVAGP